MANEVKSIVDPFGNIIYILPGTFFEPYAGTEGFDDIATVISKPALMSEVIMENTVELYYFRSIGWENTLLVNVRKVDDKWVIHNCVKNPGTTELSPILKNGRQLI